MIDWTTVFATVAIVMAIRLAEIAAEWYIDKREKRGRHGKSKD